MSIIIMVLYYMKSRYWMRMTINDKHVVCMPNKQQQFSLNQTVKLQLNISAWGVNGTPVQFGLGLNGLKLWFKWFDGQGCQLII